MQHVGSDPEAERGRGEVNLSPILVLTLRPRVGGFYVSGRLWEAQFVVCYVSGRVWEAQFIVFYVSGRFWEAQFVVFYVSGRLWEVQSVHFTCPEGSGRLNLSILSTFDASRHVKSADPRSEC